MVNFVNTSKNMVWIYLYSIQYSIECDSWAKYFNPVNIYIYVYINLISAALRKKKHRLWLEQNRLLYLPTETWALHFEALCVWVPRYQVKFSTLEQ